MVHSPFDETTSKSGVLGSSDKLISANSKEVDSFVNTASVSTDLTSVPTVNNQNQKHSLPDMPVNLSVPAVKGSENISVELQAGMPMLT